MKKKIFLFIPTLGGGGAEKMVIDLTSGINKEKYEVELFSFYDKTYGIKNRIDYAEELGVKVRFLNKHPGIDLKLLYNLYRIIRDEKPDIVHSHLETFLYVFVVAYILKIKHVHTMHSIGGQEKGIYSWLLRNSYRNSRFYMIALSKSIYSQLCLMYPKLGDRLVTIYNGVRIENYISKKDQPNIDVMNIICVANLTPVKNHRLLLTSFKNVIDINHNLHLTLVGDGPLKDDLIKMVSELGLEEYVTFTGSVKNPVTFLKVADVFVLSSHFEGMPLSVVEAMAAGLPIVAPKVGGLIEMVDENGILYNTGNGAELSASILKLTTDLNLWDKCHNESIKKANIFGFKEMVKHYENLYEKK